MRARLIALVPALAALSACAVGTIEPNADFGADTGASPRLIATAGDPPPIPGDAGIGHDDVEGGSPAGEGHGGATLAPDAAHDSTVSDAGARIVDAAADIAAPPPPPTPTDAGVADTTVDPPPIDAGPDDTTIAPPLVDAATGHTIPTPPAAAPDAATPPLSGATYIAHELTFYGWPDNSPPGPAISNGAIHASAGGTGTYGDPITFASALAEWPPGTILYVPAIQRYVIMEDICAQCTTDWASGHRHIDVWMNSDTRNGAALLKCQNGWTRTSVDVEVSPPAGRPVGAGPLFDPTSGACRAAP